MGLLDRFKKKREAASTGAPRTDEYSPGGSPIYRYQTPENQGCRPPEDVCVSMEAIEKRMEGVFPGGDGFVYHEIISDLVHIDVHVIRGPREDDGIVLYSTGMSGLPMNLPEDGKKISFYMLIPACKEEIEYKLKYGMEGLGQRFAENRLPVILDIHRPNFCADFTEVLD